MAYLLWVIVDKALSYRGAPPTFVSLVAAPAPPNRATVAAVVTIDTAFEIILPASLCPTIFEANQKQLQ